MQTTSTKIWINIHVSSGIELVILELRSSYLGYCDLNNYVHKCSCPRENTAMAGGSLYLARDEGEEMPCLMILGKIYWKQ
jgi:hypothetical protein